MRNQCDISAKLLVFFLYNVHTYIYIFTYVYTHTHTRVSKGEIHQKQEHNLVTHTSDANAP